MQLATPIMVDVKTNYSWVGPPVDAHENQFVNELKRLRQIRDHATYGKLWAKRNQICFNYFYVTRFRPLFSK